MSTSLLERRQARVRPPALRVPCVAGRRQAAVTVEVRHQEVSPSESRELERRALVQRAAQLRRRIQALRGRVARDASLRDGRC